MAGYLSDLLHATRTLTRARAFTAVCAVSLGLGMGVVMAILLLIRMVFATPPGLKTERLPETTSSTPFRSRITSTWLTRRPEWW
jgi:hypothetical protein